MPVKIRIRNFQSIKDATLVVDRLTTITGPNNSGKSAAFRAARAPFVNLKGHKFVRHGADKAIVEIDFGDGHTLYWEKGEKAKPMYRIDGGQPVYPGNAVPAELAALGVMPITVGAGDIWPQVAPQVDGQVFLLNQPGSLLAEIVADVDRVGQLNRALASAEKDKRSATAELKVRRVDEARQTKEVEAFNGLDAALDRVAAAEQRLVQVGKVAKAIEGTTALRDRLAQARGTVASLAGIEQVALPQDDLLAPILDDQNRLALLNGLRDRLAASRATVGSLLGIEDIALPGEAEFAELRSRESERAALNGLHDRLVKARAEVERLGGIEALAVAVDTALVEKVKAATAVLDGLKARWTAVREQVARTEDELAQAEANAEAAAQEARAILGDLRECPTCGATVG